MDTEINSQTTPQKNTLTYGREVIKKYVEDLPHNAGVYRMIDEAGIVLYVGKAKSLKNRVANYVNTQSLNTRLQSMISRTASMEFITTKSEAEALLLEANLIKKYAPRYNVLLKDDKSFPYIFFSGEHDFARISKHRGAKTEKGKYFGPFVSVGAVDETITLLQKAFLLRSCSDNIFKNRTRPCLQYQIKRCSAPCVEYISKADYRKLVAEASDFLSGKSRQIQNDLVQEMQVASETMDYEKASILRDRIKSLTQVQQQNQLTNIAIGDADIIVIARERGDVCVQIFSFRGGRNYGNKSYFPSNSKDHSDSEIITSFIGQFYQLQPVPKLILTSVELEDSELLEEALELSFLPLPLEEGRGNGIRTASLTQRERELRGSVKIYCPQKGDKKELVENATRNAKEALMRHLASNLSQRLALQGVKELFNLAETPKRIEVYDNSHIMGTHQVGAMIVVGAEGFIKNQYRKFDIKVATTAGDDYAMLREVLTRRFKRLKDEPENKPDLVLIDGGAGQFSVAKQVFEELGISDIYFVGIAKGVDRNAGREWFFVSGKVPFQLPEHDAVLHYLQRIRDEAHRFAIGTHRNKRSKSMQVSELDLIEGIGAVRKKALLLHFGSAKAVAAASKEEIEQVVGINKTTAELVYSHFH